MPDDDLRRDRGVCASSNTYFGRAMRIAVCSSVVPFVYGGGRNIVEWLESALTDAGHEVERVYLPHVDSPDLIFRQIAAFRWVDLSSADRIVCLRPPAHFIPHPHKVLWFIHHIRAFYDLWDSPYRGFPDDARNRGIRDALRIADTAALMEAERVFTNSRVVADRLLRFNGIDGEVLYPPIHRPERFHCASFSDEIVCVSRVEHHKRQHLLIEALRFSRSGVRLRLMGASSSPRYADELRRRTRDAGVGDRLTFDDRWTSEEEKVEALARCLAVAYIPLDEDSYGYSSLEAAYSSKAVLTTTDSGGVLELVRDGVNGIVVEPQPQALGEAMDRLYLDREATRRMGESARARLDDLGISWEHVLERLLA
jgi:glycosyltransferase involved in cell wall biosynthesis